MKTKEIIAKIESNGGLNIRNLKFMYNDDLWNKRVKGCSFQSYVAGMIKWTYGCSNCVANNVAKYFIS